MGNQTGIEWTERTWNPWMGCTKVSPGCAHCYMFRERERYGKDPSVVVRSKTTFTAPLRWKRGAGSGLVFTCSWSDWFHEGADAWRDEAWAIIRATPHLTYQILTKRPERIVEHLPADWGDGWPNVWLGVSVENQRFRDERMSRLAAIPAAVRFVSAEPLLGPLSFRWGPWYGLSREHDTDHLDGLRKFFHWVIVGGESGSEARPMALDWARTIRDECAEAGVAFFLKQLGGSRNPRAHDLAILDGQRHTAIPARRALADVQSLPSAPGATEE